MGPLLMFVLRSRRFPRAHVAYAISALFGMLFAGWLIRFRWRNENRQNCEKSREVQTPAQYRTLAPLGNRASADDARAVAHQPCETTRQRGWGLPQAMALH